MAKSYHKPVVLQVLPSLVSGGVERGTIDIAAFLTKSGLESFVASAGGPLVRDIEKAGSTHFTLPLKDKNPITMVSNAFKLAKLIRKHKINIIHARSRAPAWSAYLAAKITKCRLITTFHGTHSVNRIKKYYNIVMTKGDLVIAVSDFIASHIIETYGANQKKIRPIYRGVSLEDFNTKNVDPSRLIKMKKKCYIPDGKFIITLPGRLTSWKGHEVLLNAIAKLKNDNIYCLMVGNTKQHKSHFGNFIKLARSLGISNKVTFTGAIKDMPALYMLSDLVVAPSTRPEAFGRISIETQAMKRLIIATDIGGYKETIVSEKTGFLIPHNDVEALEKKIETVINLTHKKRVMMGNAARKNVEKKFSLKQMKEKTMKVYNEILKN
ncbi:MAG: glycosyltransferase family 4 protein [Alphaproteobacteria bacterium]|nr:glycosyltransferase family 4 protein [Alphaproteobacteria bacterium]